MPNGTVQAGATGPDAQFTRRNTGGGSTALEPPLGYVEVLDALEDIAARELAYNHILIVYDRPAAVFVVDHGLSDVDDVCVTVDAFDVLPHVILDQDCADLFTIVGARKDCPQAVEFGEHAHRVISLVHYGDPGDFVSQDTVDGFEKVGIGVHQHRSLDHVVVNIY